MSLPTEYQEFIALSRYARWLPEESRRETWEETVLRYITFFEKRIANSVGTDEAILDTMAEAEQAILNLEVMPSMRALMTAGTALDKDNVAGFNCSFRAVEGSTNSISVLTDEMRDAGFVEPVTVSVSTPIAFDEIMYVLMCGTGAGFSVERQFTNTLPVVGHKLPRSIYARNNKNFPGVDKDELSTYSSKYNTIYVADSKYGWASALRILITELYNGNFEIDWDVSKVRPAGTPLLTFGGRASGAEPLIQLFEYAKDLFRSADGRKLNSIECHGLVCKVAEIVVVGGVRRSALISLSNLSDDRMRHAKSGAWWDEHLEFALANNSVCYTERPDSETYMREMVALVESKSGERGIFNREASKNQAAKNGRRDTNYAFGTNPCSEIILRDKQFCNLSEVVVRAGDTFEDLKRKVRIAAILGTLQATLTDFKYLSPEWAKNTIEEALLGVSLTGIMDHPVLSNSHTERDSIVFMDDHVQGTVTLDYVLEELREIAIETNKEWAERLGVQQAKAITAVKPSGTVSQLVDSASGIHPRYARHYIRTVRADVKDPLAQFMLNAGFPAEPDVTKPDSTLVFSFPMEAPEGAVFREDRTAIEQLEHWLTYQRHWCEHKPSVTVYVKDEEWPEVIAWTWKYFDEISGVSFLPHSDHSYAQAPYQEIDEATYKALLATMPKDTDWSLLGTYEEEDRTAGASTMACVGGVCETVDLVEE